MDTLDSLTCIDFTHGDESPAQDIAAYTQQSGGLDLMSAAALMSMAEQTVLDHYEQAP